MFCVVNHAGPSEAQPGRLARELAGARAAARRSLRDVAGASGISAAYLQKLERGQVEEPSPKILSRLAEQLGLDYRRLMELSGYEVPAPKRHLDALASKLASAALTETEERSVAAFIEHLVAQRQR